MELAEGRDVVETGIGPGVRDHDQPVPHQHSAAIGHFRSPNASAARITSQFRRGIQPHSGRAAAVRAAILPCAFFVIPGRSEATSPESITTIASMDFGLTLTRAPE